MAWSYCLLSVIIEFPKQSAVSSLSSIYAEGRLGAIGRGTILHVKVREVNLCHHALMLRHEDVDTVIGASLTIRVVCTGCLGLEAKRAVDGRRHGALVGM